MDIKGAKWEINFTTIFTAVMILIAILACSWIILQGAHDRNKVVLDSIKGLKSEVMELQTALEKHDDKLEWWEKE